MGVCSTIPLEKDNINECSLLFSLFLWPGCFMSGPFALCLCVCLFVSHSEFLSVMSLHLKGTKKTGAGSGKPPPDVSE